MSNNRDLTLGKLLYLSPSGDRYKGRLIITPNRFLFEADFDQTFYEANRSAMVFINGKMAYSIFKDEISSVEFKKEVLNKKLLLSMNGRVHQFSRFGLSKNRIINAFKTFENE